MGRDKASIELDGEPLAARVARTLGSAGASPVAYVGGSTTQFGALPGIHIGDAADVDGPVAGLLAALAWAPEPSVVVAACDLVHIDPRLVPALHRALDEGAGEVAMIRWNGRPQAHLAIWSRASVDHIARRVADGERALRRLVPPSACWVDLTSGEELVDVDLPSELGRWAGPAKG